jgi:soluble cytochrome b562
MKEVSKSALEYTALKARLISEIESDIDKSIEIKDYNDALVCALTLYLTGSNRSDNSKEMRELASMIQLFSSHLTNGEVEEAKEAVFNHLFPKRIKPERRLKLVK